MATLLSVGLGLDSAPFIQEQRRINSSVRDLGVSCSSKTFSTNRKD
jgi:hypothetical protein